MQFTQPPHRHLSQFIQKYPPNTLQKLQGIEIITIHAIQETSRILIDEL